MFWEKELLLGDQGYKGACTCSYNAEGLLYYNGEGEVGKIQGSERSREALVCWAITGAVKGAGDP